MGLGFGFLVIGYGLLVFSYFWVHGFELSYE
jgi:hypothetical protein